MHEVPEALPSPGEPKGLELVPTSEVTPSRSDASPILYEPAMSYSREAARSVNLVEFPADEGGRPCVCVESADIARCFPDAFGVRMADSTMAPMFQCGDAAVVAIGTPARVGRPSICRLVGESSARCRIWLGETEGQVHLGRLADGEMEQVAPDQVQWALEALFRLATAA
jgi:hypothetical protein